MTSPPGPLRLFCARLRNLRGLSANAIDSPVVVLCYHRVAFRPTDLNSVVVSPDNFHAQMAYLKRNFRLARFEEPWDHAGRYRRHDGLLLVASICRGQTATDSRHRRHFVDALRPLWLCMGSRTLQGSWDTLALRHGGTTCAGGSSESFHHWRCAAKSYDGMEDSKYSRRAVLYAGGRAYLLAASVPYLHISR